LLALGGFVALCLLVAVADGLLTFPNLVIWYSRLAKPPLTPPSAVFGPVWMVLYVMMAVAAWLVWRRPWHQPALSLWGWQLAFNAAWAPVFFAGHLPLPALLIILALDVLIALTIGKFSHRDRRAAWLMAPYLGWSLFATYLNAGFWWLNR
jgi:benzodiazapine receptor